MSTAIDSARVGTTREIDNDYIITYIRRRYFLPSFFASLSRLRILFHIAAHICIKYAFGNKRNFRTGTRLGRVSQVKGIPTSGG